MQAINGIKQGIIPGQKYRWKNSPGGNSAMGRGDGGPVRATARHWYLVPAQTWPRHTAGLFFGLADWADFSPNGHGNSEGKDPRDIRAAAIPGVRVVRRRIGAWESCANH
jgi:hypothetical protein